MQYDASFRETVSLKDGSRAELRMARPEDKDLLRRGFDRMSPESRYRRFFTAKLRLSERELRYFTDVDGVDHVAIGALQQTDDGEEGLGIARFIRDKDDPGTAEPAVAVIDRVQGKGLGTLLLQHLVAAALERGIVSFHCEVLADNVGMKRLLADISDEAHFENDGSGVVNVTLPLAQREVEPAPRSMPQRVLSHVASEAVSVPLGRRLLAHLGLGDRD